MHVTYAVESAGNRSDVPSGCVALTGGPCGPRQPDPPGDTPPSTPPPTLPACLPADCGAGVGRVSRELLLHHFHEVDLLEPAGSLLEAARANLTGEEAHLPPGHRPVHFYHAALQDHVFEAGRWAGGGEAPELVL